MRAEQPAILGPASRRHAEQKARAEGYEDVQLYAFDILALAQWLSSLCSIGLSSAPADKKGRRSDSPSKGLPACADRTRQSAP